MIQVATRFPGVVNSGSCDLEFGCGRLQLTVQASDDGGVVGGHTRQRHGKFASRRWGRPSPIFWHRPAGWYRVDDGRESQGTLDGA